MKVYKLQRTQKLPISLETAWTFLCQPKNLQQLTPPSINLTITSDVPEHIYPGLIITYQLKIYKVFYFKWTTEITQSERLSYFIDEQRFGPYKFWHHEHRLQSIDGWVEIKDVVHYALPFGILGRMVHFGWIRNQLDDIFDYRYDILDNQFPEGEQHSRTI